MGSYFGEFTQTHQGDPSGRLRAPPAPHKMIASTWGHPPRAGPSTDSLGHPFPVFKQPTLHELVSTTFFNGGEIASGKSGVGAAAAAAQGRNQISSTRDAGFKKRKNQTKKVVCVPAPDAAGGKPGGEMVPSDSWSWRKYGQKPIKGSPYPRGYYRCSSSKGCSARKQVERSKTDPSMLIVTYTCEHNHPLPTQKSSSPARKVASPGSAGAPAAAKAESPEAAEALHRSGETVPPELSWTEDFFAELGELGEDTMSLVFSKEFVEDKLIGEGEEEDAMDVFRRFDWAKHSFGEAK